MIWEKHNSVQEFDQEVINNFGPQDSYVHNFIC